MAASGLICVSLLAGCSNPAETQQDSRRPANYYSSSVAVCHLLRKSDLRSTLGYEYLDGVDVLTSALTIPGITKCVYPPKRPPRKFVTTGVVYAYPREVFDQMKRERKAIESKKIGGIGEEALWFPDAGDLVVRLNDTIIAVSLAADVQEPDAHIRERARRLAEIMVRRLE